MVFQKFATSFLKLDVDGRVLRLDSFSKVLSAGIRVGYLLGPTELVGRITRKTVKSVIHAPTIIQVWSTTSVDIMVDALCVHPGLITLRFLNGQSQLIHPVFRSDNLSNYESGY